MKTITVDVTTRLVITCEDLTLTAEDIINDMDYQFESDIVGGEIVDTEILDYQVVDC